jgi:3-hydroxyacyl-CoA dehydrogenase
MIRVSYERDPRRENPMDLISHSLVGAVALIEISHPPVNALAHPVRSALLARVNALAADATVAALVIHGAGEHFVAGADIREFDAAPREPLLNDVLLQIEACDKPVIAAIRGSATGGGFELALACHYRCAAPTAIFSFPEVKLGLLPGSGGTQRLPRLIGAELALDMMLTAEPIDGRRAFDLGIVDHLADGDLVAEALEFARQLAARGAGPRRLCDLQVDVKSLPPGFFPQQFRRAEELARGHGSHDAIVQCVSASVYQPFKEGLALSRSLFEQLRESSLSRALRHLFFAERGARAPADTVLREVNRVAVLGSGTMGAGIAASMTLGGYPVALIDSNSEALQSGLGRIRAILDGAVAKGRLGAGDAAAALARVTAAPDYGALATAQLVVEAVYESMAVKREVFGQLDAHCQPGTILATNTSTLDIDAIAAATRCPEDVLGLHFFSPAHVMRLVEVVRGRQTSKHTLATALAVVRRIGKLGVVVGNCFGFVGNRMLYAYGRENQQMLLEGASPTQIDDALKQFGMAMGPNAVGDLAGLDVGYRVRRERKGLADDPRYYRPADLMVEAGRLGQKTGRGMFRYEAGSRTPLPDPEVVQMIAAESPRLGIERRSIFESEIVNRCIFALINEGARILGEGIAESAAAIDAIWCNGYGFPRWRGGPMFYADTLGIPQVVEKIECLARLHGERYWTPAPLLVACARSGGHLGAAPAPVSKIPL